MFSAVEEGIGVVLIGAMVGEMIGSGPRLSAILSSSLSFLFLSDLELSWKQLLFSSQHQQQSDHNDMQTSNIDGWKKGWIGMLIGQRRSIGSMEGATIMIILLIVQHFVSPSWFQFVFDLRFLPSLPFNHIVVFVSVLLFVLISIRNVSLCNDLCFGGPHALPNVNRQQEKSISRESSLLPSFDRNGDTMKSNQPNTGATTEIVLMLLGQIVWTMEGGSEILQSPRWMVIMCCSLTGWMTLRLTISRLSREIEWKRHPLCVIPLLGAVMRWMVNMFAPNPSFSMVSLSTMSMKQANMDSDNLNLFSMPSIDNSLWSIEAFLSLLCFFSFLHLFWALVVVLSKRMEISVLDLSRLPDFRLVPV